MRRFKAKGLVGTLGLLTLGAAILATPLAASAGTGCPNIAQAVRLASPVVDAGYTVSGNTATYLFSSQDRSPTGNVPGLIEYCVYTTPAPNAPLSVLYDSWQGQIDSDRFSFARPNGGGNSNNLPLDGTANVAVGTATWSGSVATPQTILLHINDATECDRLYGGNPGTCWVLPGLTNVAIVQACKFEDLDASFLKEDSEPFLPNWVINATGVQNGNNQTVESISATTGPSGCATFKVGTDNLDASQNLISFSEENQDGYVPTGAYSPDSPFTEQDGVVTLTAPLTAGKTYTVYFGNYKLEELGAVTVTKTVKTDDITWEISKSADKTEVKTADGNVTFDYTVSVTHTNVSSLALKGAITLGNSKPNDVVGLRVQDATNKGGTCTIQQFDTSPATTPTGTPDGSGGLQDVLAPAGSQQYAAYACFFTTIPTDEGTNTVQLQLQDGTQISQDQETFQFSDTSVSVVDDKTDPANPVTLGTVTVNDPTPKTFTYSLNKVAPAGTCTSYTNTATFTTDTSGTTGSAGQTVKVCVGKDLTVGKTATPSFTRTFVWLISKSVDKTRFDQVAGGTVTANYTVSVTHDAGTDSGWQVNGKITANNPNDWEPVTANVTDAVDNGGTCTVTGGTNVVVAASGSTVLDYACTYSSAPSSVAGTNTATATWDSAASHTPGASATGTAGFNFSTPTSLVDECVSVSDTLGGNLGSACNTDASPKTFTYTKTFTAPAAGSCKDFPNTATFTTNDTGKTGTGSQTVKVCGFNSALTPGYWKNHSAKTGTDTTCSSLKYSSCSSNGPWEKTYLPKSLGNYPVGTILVADPIWGGMNCGSSTDQGAVGCLAGHLLAAELNVANGSLPCIGTTISSANAFLAGINYVGPGGAYGLNATQRALAISLKSALDAYNNNNTCPGP